MARSGVPPGALLLAVLTFGSYCVGLLRDRVFARTFGAGSELDVYNAALVLPELVLDVLVFAGLSAAFVPVLLRTERDDTAAGTAFARTIVTTAFLVMAVAVAVLYVIAPWTAPAGGTRLRQPAGRPVHEPVPTDVRHGAGVRRLVRAG